MKKFFVLIVFISFCILYMYAGTGKCMVSEDSAVKIVKDLFPEKDYDYYIVEDNDSINWTVFVDAVPLANWEHLCYTYSVKRTLGADEILEATNEQVRKLPPSFRIRPHNLKDRFKNAPKYKAVVNELPQEMIDNQVAERTYAVILSGGIFKYSNAQRYWEDCSFIYKTLRNRFNIPKKNIVPIMSDGRNPDKDQWSVDSCKHISQYLDLDGDGIEDIEYEASKKNLVNIIRGINIIAKEGDHFFLFVTDHGGLDEETGHSYICLWGVNNVIYDYELAEVLKPLTQKGIHVNVVLGQCYSGGFIDDLDMIGCVTSTACKEEEPSGFIDVKHDEFLYQWTCAINETDINGILINSDKDKDGRITLKEAYHYAKTNDRYNETPQYSSNPEVLGDELAFNYIPPTTDLIIKDNYNDYGEKSDENSVWWNSPSIYARNKNDCIPVHENITLKNTSKAYIYVKIHNRGIRKYKNDDICHLYWSLASTNIPSNVWMDEDNNMFNIKGGLISSKRIPEIEAGDSIVLTFEWIKPTLVKESEISDILYKDTENYKIVFRAIINNTKNGYDNTWSEYSNVANSNKIAEKNQSNIELSSLSKFSRILVRNTSAISNTISLEFCPESENDLALFDNAKIGIRFPEEIYQALSVPNKVTKFENDNNTIYLSKERTVINNIPVKKGKDIEVGLKVTYFKAGNDDNKYTFHLIQKDSIENTMGGMTFIVAKPTYSFEPLNIQLYEDENGAKRMYINNDSISSLIWFTPEDEFMDDKLSVSVSPLNADASFKAAALNSNGSLSTGQIAIAKDTGIKSISSLSNFSDEIEVEFYSPCGHDTSIIIVSNTSGEIKSSRQVQTGDIITSISVSALERGIYSLIYATGKEVIDSIKFTKQ